MKTDSRFARLTTRLALAFFSVAYAFADFGAGAFNWARKQATSAGNWLTAKLIGIASTAPAKADQVNLEPAERLRAWREQYQARTLKRETPTVTDRWRMCPSI